jgi:PAS domain S-box-containing protein
MFVVFVDPVDAMGHIERMLREEDETITVETVGSPAAITDLDRAPDCVVVLDYVDEGVDGVGHLRAVEDRLGDVPVVAFSIEPEAYTAQKTLGAGAADVICVGSDGEREAKPEFPVLLTRRIRHAAGMGEAFQTDSELLDSVMKYLPHQVFIKDDSGRIVESSSRVAHEHGLTREQMVGLTDHDLMDPETAMYLEHQEREIMETGDAAINEISRYVDEMGRDRWVSVTKAPRYDDENNVGGIIGTTRDVTGQMRQEEMMNALHAASRDLVAAETRQEIVETAVDIADDIPDLPLLEVIIADDESDDLRTVETDRGGDESRESGQVRDAEASLLERYGEWIRRAYETRTEQLLVSVDDDSSAVVGYAKPEASADLEPVAVTIPLGEHGVLGFAATSGTLNEVGIDLAEVLAANMEAALDRAARERALRERERELSRQNERLEEFASIVSHDLRNPLSVAQGYAEMFDEDDPSGQEVQWALERMERLTEELLTLARQGQIVGETESVAIRSAATDAWQAVSVEEVTLAVEDDPGVVEADRERLLELLENLFRNAVEHAHGPDDPVTVTVGTLDGDRQGFYVADDGPGIPDDRKEQVFDQGYTTADDGTGFGLYIVETLADAHGWSVQVVDAGGERGESSGARFEVEVGQ